MNAVDKASIIDLLNRCVRAQVAEEYQGVYTFTGNFEHLLDRIPGDVDLNRDELRTKIINVLIRFGKKIDDGKYKVYVNQLDSKIAEYAQQQQSQSQFLDKMGGRRTRTKRNNPRTKRNNPRTKRNKPRTKRRRN